MQSQSLWALPIAVLMLGGCAAQTVQLDGRVVARNNLNFGGDPYYIRHSSAHPEPGGPSSGTSGWGGQISGRICGLDINYEVHHRGDRVELNGFIDNSFSSQITVRDTPQGRRITGNLGVAAGYSAIDLQLTDSALVGRVSRRRFDLHRNGDRYVGTLRFSASLWSDAVVEGYAALIALPPADQAAILSLLLTCNAREIEVLQQHGLRVQLGGPIGNHPSRTSSLYLH